jgi:hypothetical protein
MEAFQMLTTVVAAAEYSRRGRHCGGNPDLLRRESLGALTPTCAIRLWLFLKKDLNHALEG